MESQWSDPLFKQVAIILLTFLGTLGLLLFPFRKKNTHMTAAWASFQSWLFFAPILFLMLAAGHPFPLLGITFISLLCAKEFFQITGMYHKSIFVWATYLCIVAYSYCVHKDYLIAYETLPMLFLGILSIIPILLNQAKNMLQFIALSLICSMFVGWGFLHTAWIVKMPNGAFFLIYIILLTELSDNISLAISRIFGKKKIFSNITTRRTIEGYAVAHTFTYGAAYVLKIMLPLEIQYQWWIYGTIAVLVGSTGDLILSVIRRDLGVKDYGIFIIGRGGLLDRMDRLIFVAPIYYYVITYL